MGNTLPDVKEARTKPCGNALPAMGNTLHGMPKNQKKMPAGAILAQNLKMLLQTDRILNSGPKVAKASGVSRKSINNIADNRHDPHLSSVEAIAKAYGIEAYQILTPGLDNNLLAIYRVYSETDESGRDLIAAAAEAVRKARERRNGKTGTDE